MKSHFTLLLVLLVCNLFGQTDRTRYTVACSFHQSDAAGSGPGSYFDPALGKSIIARAELSTKRSLRFTIGAGYLQSRMQHSDLHYQTHEDIEQQISINSIITPGGIKFTFGSFYIHPEVAASFNYLNTISSYFLDTEMNPLNEPYNQNNYNPPIEVQFTSLMSMGYEWKVGSMAILTGLQGYFAFNNNYVNTFGAGLLLGLKI